MDKEYFLSAGIPPPMHFEPSPMTAWESLSLAPELNHSSKQSSDCFFNPSWDKSTDQFPHFESALSSMVSSPAASNSAMSGDSFAIRELIGKLGNICNSSEITPESFPLLKATAATSYVGGGNHSANTSGYSTPLNSPPKLPLPIMNGNSMPMNPTLPALSADPGFAERAAKFSCFGSRSFSGRTDQFRLNSPDMPYGSIPLMGAAKISRVASSPSLKAAGSPMVVQENKNSSQTQMEMRLGVDKKFSKLSGPASSEFASSNEEFSVCEQIASGDTGLKTPNEMNSRKRKSISRGKVKEVASSQPANATKVVEAEDDSNSKRSKTSEGNGNENGGLKTEEEAMGSNNGAGEQAKSNQKPPEPPKDYIHVRARRGQATDSHSLAERVRREKISERMKLLQDLVPGCNKVTGKALMLDQIINYVQSLQRQVEFLSMKLASVNPSLDFNMDSLLSKDIFQSNGSLPQPIYPLDSAFYGHRTQQSPQVQTNVSNGEVTQCSVDPLPTTLCRNIGMQLPPVDEFGQGLPQFPTFCENDLQSIVQMGFGQNSPNHDTAFHSESIPGSDQTSHMKHEL
ncbi:hypothetical protein F0562_021702 [Nyssa sinensis]|uniref:BHLH domain-containing protein n=1 Tax=Nyssa sinensis TaxID=561372 RepID=A0A5J5BPA6_9ASTE|nr:hypothetical protein F0562_021702 [Nyssa sinensis]